VLPGFSISFMAFIDSFLRYLVDTPSGWERETLVGLKGGSVYAPRVTGLEETLNAYKRRHDTMSNPGNTSLETAAMQPHFHILGETKRRGSKVLSSSTSRRINTVRRGA